MLQTILIMISMAAVADKRTEPMYVCLCKGITDTQIRAAAAGGCDSMRELAAELGAGSQCGKCARHAREILREARAELAPSRVLEVAPVAWCPQLA